MNKKLETHNDSIKCNCKCSNGCRECKCKSGNGKKTAAAKISVFLFLIFLADVAGLCRPADASVADSNLAGSKPGLLIVAHGAPSPEWNKPVLDLERVVKKELGSDSGFGVVRVVFMEFKKPSVADGVKECELAGCSRIIVVPLLIAPSSHSHWDIPALLGLYSNAEAEKQLKKEGAQIIRSKIPITLTSTLADSNVIEQIMLNRVTRLSKDPNNEAVVLLAHGDHMTPLLWEKFMKRTTTHICGKTGISYGDWACVEMGQNYDDAASVIACAGEYRKKIIVIGAYMSMGVDKIHTRWMQQFDSASASMPGLENPLKNLDIVLCEEGLLPDSSVGEWIAEVSKGELVRNSTAN